MAKKQEKESVKAPAKSSLEKELETMHEVKKQQVTVYISPANFDLLDALHAYMEAEDRTASYMMLRAFREYTENHTPGEK